MQDEGSQLAALLAGARPGMRVVDFCAGAGGKTLALAAGMANRGKLVACDVSARRLERAGLRLRRAGVGNVERRVLSSENDKWVKRHAGGFDLVFVDVPCLGTGTWRRNPDAKWRSQPEDLAELILRQQQILRSAARLVRAGGRLVYATCSLLREEDEAQAEAFLAASPDFSLFSATRAWARNHRRRLPRRRGLPVPDPGAPRHRRLLRRPVRAPPRRIKSGNLGGPKLMPDRILILDFGSQVTQLIARRVRESGVYCEIHPYTIGDDKVRDFDPRAIILSGGPASVTEGAAPRAPAIAFRLGVPVLGICYGMQTMCDELGGRVALSEHQEFGRAFVDILDDCLLFDGLWPKGGRAQVWMSHGDKVDVVPAGFRAVAASEAAPFAAIADDERRFYGFLFHPEVAHTPQGGGTAAQLHPQGGGLPRRLDDGLVPRRCDRADPRTGRARQCRLRVVGRGRFRGRRGVAARGGRRPADLHLCRHRPVARRRSRRGRRPVPPASQHPAGPSRRRRSVPGEARRGHRPRRKAQADRRRLYRRVRRGGAEARRRRVSGAGDALPRRDRVDERHRRPFGHDQVAPQCRRAARRG